MFEITDLNFSYGDYNVFENFSFHINKGESLCIIGSNGSGKTTLLKILCGLNYYPQLKCEIDGVKFTQNDLKKIITYIPATPNFYESLSLKEYVAWVKAMWNKDESFYSKVNSNLKYLKLNIDENMEISTYSLGMKYKLYFCTFLALDNPILLLDEPLNSLDINSRDIAISLIKNYIKDHNGYCLFSSHVADTISELSNRIIKI